MEFDGKTESSLDHIWHTWMNQYSDGEGGTRGMAPHSLYEFKGVLQFLRYGHEQIQKAFKGELATQHRQCSRQLPVPILDNRLRCCLGTNVLECPILTSLASKFQENVDRVYPFNGKKAYPDISADHLYVLMARTCAWHIFSTAVKASDKWGGIDTSEGYLLDESDRMYWRNLYEGMAAMDQYEEGEE